MKITRVLAAVLAAIVVLLAPGAALAQAAYVTANATIYAQPDTSARSAPVAAGTQVDLVGVKNGWAMVRRGGVTAFMDAAKLEAVRALDGATVYAREDLVLSASPAQGAKRVADVPAGAKLRLYMAVGDWAGVRYGSKKGFVPGVGLSAEAPESGAAPQATPAPERQRTLPGYARGDGVRVYAAASTDSDVLATLSLNSEVAVSGVRGGWCRVVNGASVGFVRKADLATGPVERAPEATPAPEATARPQTRAAYARRDGVCVYESYSTSSRVLSTLSANDQVDVSAIKNGWCRVIGEGSVAYVRQADLAPARVEEAPKSYAAYAQVEGACVYQRLSRSSRVLARLPLNFEVAVTAAHDGWAQVRNGRYVGYMLLDEIGTARIEAAPAATPAPEAAVTGYVKHPGARVYAAPNAAADVLAALNLNDEVGMCDVRDGWAQVVNGSSVGYMLLADLSGSQVQVAAAYVRTAGAKVYAQPAASAAVLASLSLNDQVALADKNGDWGLVVNGSGAGYMLLADLSAAKVEAPALKYGDTGEAVRRVQTRLKELGFFAGTVGGNYMAITQSAVEAFQAAAKLPVNGVVDENTLKAMLADGAPKNAGGGSGESAGYSTAAPASGGAVEMDWWTSDIQRIFARGTTAKITDVATGIAWYEKRTGGTNHADVQPVSAADTNSMRRAVGSWSWTRRPIFVTVGGVNYAASMNAMPHGSGSIKNNNFNGHHCIHFTNSRTHGSNRVCSLHQSAIKKALSASL